MRWVVFDIGGVLARIRDDWADCLSAIGAGVPAFRSGPCPISDFPLFDRYQQGLVSWEQYLRALAAFLKVDLAAAARAHDAILVESFEGTEAIVDALHAANVRTACLSNTNARHWPILTSADRFPNVAKLQLKVASHEVRLRKPDPRIYGIFAELAGARGGEIVYFEDHPQSVRSALEAGWSATLVNPGEDASAQIAEALVRLGILN